MQIHCATYIIIYAFIIYSYCPFIARNLQVLFDYWLLPFINFLYICIITKRWQFFPCTRSVTPPLLRNLLIWFVLFVMQKLEVYYYYPYIRTPHFSLRLPNKSNLWSPKRGNELLTEFFFFRNWAWKEDDVHDVVDEWVVSFVYGHSDHFAPSRKRLLRHCEISQDAHKNENRQKGQITSGKENGGAAWWKKKKNETENAGGAKVEVSQARKMQLTGLQKRCIWRWLQTARFVHLRNWNESLKRIS